jgi:ubiquinone/menaquinone biosynthesis C-methylase UbiE
MAVAEISCDHHVSPRRLRDTYNFLYDKGYADSGSCYVLADLLLERAGLAPPVLDVGCGHCPFLKVARERTGLRALFGVDISDVVLRENTGEFRLAQASAARLPFGDKMFRVCYSADMIEHLPEGDAIQALREMARVTSGVLAVGASCRKAYTLDEHGQQVHLTVRPADWWQQRIAELGKLLVAHFSDDLHGFFIAEV